MLASAAGCQDQVGACAQHSCTQSTSLSEKQYVFFWQEVRDISVIKREQSYAGNKLVVLGEVIVFISSPVVDC